MSLPNTYTKLAYLESTGTQYIDTGICFTANFGCDITYAYTTLTDDTDILGCDNDGNNTWSILLNCYTYNSNIVNRAVVGDASEASSFSFSTNILSASTAYNTTIVSGDGAITITQNNTVWNTLSKNVTSTKPLFLFARNQNDSVGNLSSARLFKCSFKINNTLVRDFVPAKRNSDSATGLYDLVNDVFYENQGTGTFIAGYENILLEDNPLELTLESDVELQANFELIGYEVTATINPEGYGTVRGVGAYPEGATVSLFAQPKIDKIFNNWTVGSSALTTNPYVFTMGSSPVNVTANFGNLTSYGLGVLFHRKATAARIITVTQTTNGSVVGGGMYYDGDICTLTATPSSGYVFNGWSDGTSINPYQFTVSSDVNISATFVPERVYYTNFPAALGTNYTAVSSYSGSTNMIASTDNTAVTWYGYYASNSNYSFYSNILSTLNYTRSTNDRELHNGAMNSSSWVMLGLAKPLTVESITCKNSNGDHCYEISSFDLYGSEDGSTWTSLGSGSFDGRNKEITLSITGTWTWFKFVPTAKVSPSSSGGSYGSMFAFKFTGTY